MTRSAGRALASVLFVSGLTPAEYYVNLRGSTIVYAICRPAPARVGLEIRRESGRDGCARCHQSGKVRRIAAAAIGWRKQIAAVLCDRRFTALWEMDPAESFELSVALESRTPAKSALRPSPSALVSAG